MKNNFVIFHFSGKDVIILKIGETVEGWAVSESYEGTLLSQSTNFSIQVPGIASSISLVYSESVNPRTLTNTQMYLVIIRVR